MIKSAFTGTRIEIFQVLKIYSKIKFVVTIRNSRVHDYCKKNKINFFLVNKLNKEKIFETLAKKKLDLLLSAGFPYIFPSYVFKSFKLCLNSHPGLLPNYKGKNSIKDAFRKREKKIGTTLHILTDKVDSGKIIYQDFIKTKNLDLNSIYNILFSFTEPHVVNKGLIKILSKHFTKKTILKKLKN